MHLPPLQVWGQVQPSLLTNEKCEVSTRRDAEVFVGRGRSLLRCSASNFVPHRNLVTALKQDPRSKLGTAPLARWRMLLACQHLPGVGNKSRRKRHRLRSTTAKLHLLIRTTTACEPIVECVGMKLFCLETRANRTHGESI